MYYLEYYVIKAQNSQIRDEKLLARSIAATGLTASFNENSGLLEEDRTVINLL